MTDEELKQTINNIEIGIYTIGETEYLKVRRNVLVSILENYKELLHFRELHTPKKPIKAKGEIVCPLCKTLVGSNPYCKYCGQALDWSETK